MINTIMLIFWGIYVAVVGYKVLRAVITYEMNRHKDKKLLAEGIYVVRLKSPSGQWQLSCSQSLCSSCI